MSTEVSDDMRTNGNHREAGTEIQTAAAITANHDPAGILREIFRQLGGIEITRRRGARFSFRFYLTKSMEETTIDSLELSVRSNNSLKRRIRHDRATC